MDLVDRLTAALLLNPPTGPGLDRAYVMGFFRRKSGALREMVAGFLAQAAEQGKSFPNAAEGPFRWPADPTAVGERGRLNIAAMEVLAAAAGSALSDGERLVVARYSGWGGLKLKPYERHFPAGFPVPEARGLLHEFYTPTRVWGEIARVLKAAREADDIPTDDLGVIRALEPSAGIGRALRAFQGWPMSWTALEASAVSVRLLRALFPTAVVEEGFAERWVANNPTQTFDLIAANPPYGARGEAMELDPEGYKSKQAYIYFLIRFSERLVERGIGVWIIPTGFLTSKAPTFEKARRAWLARAHLSAAFRMPSIPPEGGDISDVVYDQFPVDILFSRGRGGVAREVSGADLAILEGRYFEAHPDHVLGQLVGELADSEDAPSTLASGAMVRRGMQVIGSFREFPPFEARPFEQLDLLEAKKDSGKRGRGGLTRQRPVAMEADVPLRVRTAVSLGVRVDAFLAAVAAEDLEKASLMQRELAQDLQAWRVAYGKPTNDAAVGLLAEQHNTAAQRFLAAWRNAELLPVFTTPIKVRGGYIGVPELPAFATWLFRKRGGLPLPLSELVSEFVATVPGARAPDDVRAALITAGWCLDGDAWDLAEPASHYYTGFLWPRVDRARVDLDRPGARVQERTLRERIGWISATQLIKDSAPNQPWIPLDVLSEWASLPMNFAYDAEEKRGVPCGASWPSEVPFERQDGLLTIAGVPYGTLNNTDKGRNPAYFERQALSFLGWVNGDSMMFTTSTVKEVDELGQETTVPPEKIRRAMERHWIAGWQAWLRDHEEVLEALEETYNRTLRGYVTPTYSSEPIDVARWGEGITLHPHQNEAGRKIIANGCGLLAFDVGVGKTYTAIKLVAKMRQEGRAKRPAVLVPNTIIWKWFRDFARCLPDFRVLVVGSNRKQVEVEIERNGRREVVRRWVARNDTPAERAQKWTDFQAGLYDVVLVTYSAFSRQQIDEEFVGKYVASTVAIRRAITLALEEEDKEDPETGETKKKKTRKRTERKEADIQERARAWVGDMLAPPKSWAYDPGVDWHQLGIDLLVVDEAQNFKNLFYSSREGASDRQAAKRAWALDFRCASVRAHTGGGGVVLLSATPMKNAAAEFYNLLHLVNPRIWEQVGVSDPEGFISMFANMEMKMTTLGTGEVAERFVVTGFHHVDVLKSVVFRWATFKTAQQVGLKLPEVTRVTHLVSPTQAQLDTFAELFEELEVIEEKVKKVAKGAEHNAKMRGVLQALKYKRQGVQARLYLCALHPGLVGGPGRPEDGPKLVECVNTVLKTRPQVCETAPPPGERWVSRPTVCDGGPDSPEDLCASTDGAWCLTCGHIIFAENLEVHYWLKALFIAGGIPAERIAILNAKEASDLELRQQIAERFNGRGRPDSDDDYEPPAFDVIICNAVAYEGIDLQTRTCAIHHLDVPWEAATLQQRNGRGVRQGNRFLIIGIHFYFVKGSTETQRLGKIERKRRIMLDLYEEGDLATNTVVADELSGDSGEEESDVDAYLAFAPPEVAARIRAAQAEERAREEAAREAKARLRANELVADLVGVKRRLLRAAERTEKNVGALQAEADGLVRQIRGYPDVLWTYNWQAAASEALLALDQSRDVAVLALGPALVQGARWRLLLSRNNGTSADWHPMEITRVDGEGPWVRIPGALDAIALRPQLDIYTIYDWKPGWTADVEGVDARVMEGLRTGTTGQRSLLSVPLDTDGATWSRHGDVVMAAAWKAFWPSIQGRRFPTHRKVGDKPVPMIGGSGLGFWGEEEFEDLDGRVLPRTWDGWRRFWAAVRAEKRLKYTRLAEIALFWWGRELPTGILGADHRAAEAAEEGEE